MDDCEIIRAILNGDIDRYELLVDKYRTKVFSAVGRRVQAQDCESVAQDVFIRAFRGLSGFDLSKPFENWLMTIAVRTCYDYWRSRSKEERTTVPLPNQDYSDYIDSLLRAGSNDEFEKQVRRKETLELLEIVMRRLSPEDRTLVELIYFDGWKLKDAAEVLKWRLSKTKVRAMRARKLLRKYIEEIVEANT